MSREPASRALSNSSLTTEAGRSTTSPAAIWLISSSGNSAIGRIGCRAAPRGCDDESAVVSAVGSAPFRLGVSGGVKDMWAL